MPGEVAAPFRRRDANLFKARPARRPGSRGNHDIRRPEDGRPVIGCVGTEEQAQGLGIEAVVEVMKELVEVVRAGEQLICQFRSKSRIEHQRVVKNMNGSDLEIVMQVRTGRSQSWTPSRWGGLATLSA